MKKRIFLLFLVATSLHTFAQEKTVYKYWVEFTDKAGSPFNPAYPEKFLSARALERRAKHGIKVTEQDLPVNPAYLTAVSGTGVKVLNPSRWFNAVSVETDDSTRIALVRNLPMVKSTRLVYHKTIDLTLEPGPNKSGIMMEMLMGMGAKQEGEPNTKNYGQAYNQIEMINGITLHEKGYEGQGMIIAVLDAGFYKFDELKTFNLLREENRLLGTWDFVKQETSVYEDDLHGMNVTSCMAAYTPGKMIGTAPKASYWLLRTEDAGTEFPIEEANWVSGAEFADSSGADIINSSLGYSTFDDPKMSYTYASLDGKTALISRAALLCSKKGMIVVNAAGNSGSDAWKYIGVPADADSILSIGGVNSIEEHASFSSYGPTSDGRIKPTVCAKAEETIVASSFGKFYPSQGTSFASPVMCGMVACLWQAHPTVTNMEIIEAIKKSSDRYLDPNNQYGYGVPDFLKAHRILGGDPQFDYTADQVLEAPALVQKGQLKINFYSAKKQTLTVVLKDRKGKEMKRWNIETGEKEFLAEKIKDVPVIKKGKGTVEIITSGKNYLFEVVEIN